MSTHNICCCGEIKKKYYYNIATYLRCSDLAYNIVVNCKDLD